MALAIDLVQTGIPSLPARVIGFNPAVAVVAAGTTTANATVLGSGQNFVTMTATGADGVRFPTGLLAGKEHVVVNTSGSIGKVYPPTGSSFNGLAADTAISVPANKAMVAWRYSSTGWSYNLSA